MGTVNRTIQDDYQRDMAAKLVANRPYPFTLSITDGKHRSTAQNRLQNMWFKEIAEQKGDIKPAEARAYCKLTIGIPILREQNEAFRARYDEVVKPLSYEQKLAIMQEPLNFPVTSQMNTKQFTEYLDGIIRHFGEQGIVLTMPDDIRQELYRNTDTDETALSQSVDAGMKPAEGEVETPPAASPSNDPERDILIRFAAEMLPMAAAAKTEVWKDVELGWSEGEMKGLSPEGFEKAKTVSTSIRQIARGNISVEIAAKACAKVLGCKPSDLGGVDG
ncbi:hypothetical protein [Agrobacterium larrymoorei]|uniref:hypothetical protein n=1 Tax=Agrobacterium larrymoorei TaxID=160699 RepID=UPI0030C39D18